MIYYTYHICWTSHNMHYYGFRGTNIEPSADLWHKYFTSSKYVKQYRKEYGEPDIIEVRKTFTEKSDAINWERKFLIRVKARKSKHWLNRYDGTYNGAYGPKNHGAKISAATTGIKKSLEHCENVSKSLIGKYTHLTDGIKNVCILQSDVEEFILRNPGFSKGRVTSEITKKKISVSRKKGIAEGRIVPIIRDMSGENNPMYDKHHTDETKTKISVKAKQRMSDPANRPYGEKNGMFGKTQSEEAKREASIRTSRRRWYTNDIINIYIDIDLQPPEGFRKGRKKFKRRTKAEMNTQNNQVLEIREDKTEADSFDDIA